jgi:hypothetical protein
VKDGDECRVCEDCGNVFDWTRRCAPAPGVRDPGICGGDCGPLGMPGILGKGLSLRCGDGGADDPREDGGDVDGGARYVFLYGGEYSCRGIPDAYEGPGLCEGDDAGDGDVLGGVFGAGRHRRSDGFSFETRRLRDCLAGPWA